MPTKVLIVDDSSFFRKRLKEIIESDPTMSVVGEAKDGKEGVDMTVKLRPDVITMDVEMPVMDGITSVKEIMAKCPTPVLMFSSLTHEGASATFKALEAGAIDFMPKNFDDIAHRREDATKALIQSIKTVSRSRVRRVVSSTLSSARPATSTVASARLATTTAARPSLATATTARPGAASTLSRPSTLASRTAPASAPASSSASATSGAALGQFKKISDLLVQDPGVPAAAKKFTFGDHKAETTAFRKSGKTHKIVAIGSSTGGPIALQEIIPKLPKLNVPVIVVQHMPGSFTQTFASRLDGMSQLHVVEGKDAVKKKIDELILKGNEKTVKENDTLEILLVANEMLCRGFSFLPVDLYLSRAFEYIIEDNKIRLPFSSLKGLGETAAKKLQSCALDGEYISIEDLVSRTGISKVVVQCLKDMGALKNMPETSQMSLLNF